MALYGFEGVGRAESHKAVKGCHEFVWIRVHQPEEKALAQGVNLKIGMATVWLMNDAMALQDQ
eukprot:3758351-Amphidinium_carterae.1